MKIRLLAPDSLIPNFAIMKISTYHKRLGDNVDWYSHIEDCYDTDILYISKIFTFTKDVMYLPYNQNCKIFRGGTGYDIKSKLPQEIEEITELDYSLYPDCDYSIIFTTRGCIRHCSFCVVRDKEGLIHDVPMVSLNPKGKYIRVQDNNFFASNTWKCRIEQLRSFNQPIDFNGGIDLRILNEEMCVELKKCKIKSIKIAFDDIRDKKQIIPKLELITKYIKGYKLICYVLVGNKEARLLEEDIERVNILWNQFGIYPFVMPYIDYNDTKRCIPNDLKAFARWCNNRFIFKSCSWQEYRLKGE